MDQQGSPICFLCACSVTQLCLILCDPMDCSPPGSPVHGILQVRIMEWVTISSFRESSWLRDQTGISCISCIGRWITLPLSPLGSPFAFFTRYLLNHYLLIWYLILFPSFCNPCRLHWELLFFTYYCIYYRNSIF